METVTEIEYPEGTEIVCSVCVPVEELIKQFYAGKTGAIPDASVIDLPSLLEDER
jgi:hypothetical protein